MTALGRTRAIAARTEALSSASPIKGSAPSSARKHADSAERTRPNTLYPCRFNAWINGRPMAPVAPANRTLISNLPYMNLESFREKSLLYWNRQFSVVGVHHEDREEPGRPRLTGIGADAVAVARKFGEALSGLVGRDRSIVHLAPDCSLQHSRIDEGRLGMHVSRRVATRAVFDEHALDALA